VQTFTFSANSGIRTYPFAWLLLSAILLAAGPAFQRAEAIGLGRKELTLNVTVAKDVNRDSPVSVDVVLVKDKKTLSEIAAMTSRIWFEKKTDVLRMKGKQVHVTSFEWTPSEVVPRQHVNDTGGQAGILLFAGYSTKGEHRAALPASGTVKLELGSEDFKLHLPGKGGSEP
jgi:hypothetical protein